MGSRSRGATAGTGMLAGARACRCLHRQPPALQSSPIPRAGSESGAGTPGWPYPGTTSPVVRPCPPCQVLLSAPLLTALKLVNEQTGFFFITNFSPYKSAVKAQLGRLFSSTLLRRPGRSLAGSLHILREPSSLLGTTCPGDRPGRAGFALPAFCWGRGLLTLASLRVPVNSPSCPATPSALPLPAADGFFMFSGKHVCA